MAALRCLPASQRSEDTRFFDAVEERMMRMIWNGV